jgi:hypothetical protein
MIGAGAAIGQGKLHPAKTSIMPSSRKRCGEILSFFISWHSLLSNEVKLHLTKTNQALQGFPILTFQGWTVSRGGPVVIVVFGGVNEGCRVGVGVSIWVGVFVDVVVKVGVNVSVAVEVCVGDKVAVRVEVGVYVLVAVGVGASGVLVGGGSGAGGGGEAVMVAVLSRVGKGVLVGSFGTKSCWPAIRRVEDPMQLADCRFDHEIPNIRLRSKRVSPDLTV